MAKIAVVEEADVARAVEPGALMAAIRQTMTRLQGGRAVQPPQNQIDLGQGADAIAYHGLDGEAKRYCLKISPYLPQPEGPPVVTAWSLLLDTLTGEPVALLDAGTLTALRTAATSLVAVEALVTGGRRTVAVVGTGRLGRAHARFAAATGRYDHVVLVSRTHEQARRRAQQWNADGDIGAEVKPAENLADVAQDVDVLLLCTSAAEPVVDLRARPQGSITTSISTNAVDAREVDPSALSSCEVYVDHAAAGLAVGSEFRLARESGTWSDEMLRGDLPALVSGSAPTPTGQQPVYFRSVGLGLEDLAAAQLVVSTLQLG